MKPESRIPETFEHVLARRLARRDFMKGAAASASMLLATTEALTQARGRRLRFEPIRLNTDDKITVANGYRSDVVLRWGDPLSSLAPDFDVNQQSALSQSNQFGYNCDFVGYFPFPRTLRSGRGRNQIERGLLTVNHEYIDVLGMFPGYVEGNPTKAQVDIGIAAHGVSVVEVVNRGRGWQYVKNSPFNRRITGETLIEITGPAAGHNWLRTSYDPRGLFVRGTLNNCGGGKTPWGTMLTAEENFNDYFANVNNLPADDPRRPSHTRYGVLNGATEYRWENYYDRFDASKEPNEPFRFGWVVEIDPFDPFSMPKKRTALGRTKHEAATVVLSKNERAVVYLGDDQRFDYMYKFVSQQRVNLRNPRANGDVLDSGTLYVAKFNDDGTGEWMPMIAGQGKLNGWTPAEVLLNTRIAADAMGATKMDRPEDIETNPVNGKVYCVFTNNTQRGTTGRPNTDKANPRATNRHGHIIELTERGDDPAATSFNWEIFMLCGDPNVATDGTYFAGWKGPVSTISVPDNIAFDNQGNLWIATDGQPGTIRFNDGLYAVPCFGSERGYVRQFMSAPIAAEVTGPEFTPDNRTIFCSIQHPGEGSTFARPSSTWPEGSAPSRPSVIALTSEWGNDVIGS